jgi:two-component system, NarL family, sensor histidine kinase UhpB
MTEKKKDGNHGAGTNGAVVTEIAERERAAIARELHDTIGAEATSLCLMIQNLELIVSRLEPTEEMQNIAKTVKAISARADNIYKMQREFSTKLRPSTLDVLGLEATVRQIVSEEQSTHPDRRYILKWTGTLPVAIDDLIEITVVRVIQEALLNVAKHSQAWVCSITVRITTNQIQVNVTDPGVGLMSGINVAGIGLQGMAERVAQVGGLFKAARRINGQGTEIAFAVPHSGGTLEGTEPENATRYRE